MTVIKVNPDIAGKIYSEVEKFIAGRVRKIDAIAALSALVIQQCLDSDLPKQLFLNKISEIWDALEKSDKCQ